VLEVAMHDARAAGVGDGGQQVLEHARDLRQRQVSDERAQRPALDQLHRDVRRAAVLEVLVDGHDVGVVQRARHPRLAQKTLGERRVARVEAAELLQRDESLQVALAREVDDRHAAAPQLADDVIAVERHG